MGSKRSIYVNITAMGVVKIILVLVLFYCAFIAIEVFAMLFVALVLSIISNFRAAWSRGPVASNPRSGRRLSGTRSPVFQKSFSLYADP